MILFLLASFAVAAPPTCGEAMNILAMSEECIDESSAVPLCVSARTVVAMCDRGVVADAGVPVERPPATLVATRPPPVTPPPPPIVERPTPPPIAPPPAPPPVTTSTTVVVMFPVTATGSTWQYIIPGYSSPPVAADPAVQWATYNEEQQWAAINAVGKKASAAHVATDNLYTTLQSGSK